MNEAVPHAGRGRLLRKHRAGRSIEKDLRPLARLSAIASIYCEKERCIRLRKTKTDTAPTGELRFGFCQQTFDSLWRPGNLPRNRIGARCRAIRHDRAAERNKKKRERAPDTRNVMPVPIALPSGKSWPEQQDCFEVLPSAFARPP